MPEGLSHNNQHEFEQVVTTIFACRSIIKYISALGEQQKNELLAEIDMALQLVRTLQSSHMITPGPPSVPHTDRTSMQSLTFLQAPLPISSVSMPGDQPRSQEFQDLYKLYHQYLNSNPSISENSPLQIFAERFQESLALLAELQSMLEQEHISYTSAYPPTQALHQLKNSVSDLYYIFMEFLQALSQILEQHDVHVDTEGLQPAPVSTSPLQESYQQEEIAPLLGVYQAHQHLQATKGPIATRVGSKLAFLQFLKERIRQDHKQRAEITNQLNEITILFHEIVQLLTDYESATSVLMNRRR